MQQLDDNGIDLLRKMLRYDPSKRIHASEALKHPYFDDIDKSAFIELAEDNNELSAASANAQPAAHTGAQTVAASA